MEVAFRPHNLHLESVEAFLERDPHLVRLGEAPLVHRSRLLDRLPADTPGIYTLGGGRQVGKTTLVKQWMGERLRAGQLPESLCFVTGELIDDHHALLGLFERWRSSFSGFGLFLVDEVTYIPGWDQGIKYLADAGLLRETAVLVTGSDLAMIREARVRLPGRRGDGEVVDFHLHPLDFRDVVELKQRFNGEDLQVLLSDQPTDELIKRLFGEFDDYLVHGGYLTAINDLAGHGMIRTATCRIYSDWIRGDILRHGKSERYLREVLGALLRRYGSQLTWNALARDLSIDHPATVADYVQLLERMDAVHIRHALREDRLAPAPKKARKVDFADPFILHAVRSWLEPDKDPLACLQDPETVSFIVEGVVAGHLHRRRPTYYIKAAGEVDLAWVEGDGFQPVEIKWTRQRRPKDLRQIARYPNGQIWDRNPTPGTQHNIPTTPIPQALLRLEPIG